MSRKPVDRGTPRATQEAPPPMHRQLADLMVDACDPDVSDACCVILKHLAHRHMICNTADISGWDPSLIVVTNDGSETDSGGSK
ncbi:MULTISPECIES: hypothetical protein [unclassified Thalassospira]|uniref:hypothetical protein n=1 Tax=unclassified Thalassospira TaxID=2648997 RepID=UPI0007A5E383|nr:MULTISPECIES: hypothetical protein [unclassified Thalassospira]ONH85365.1 hypothetical protein TH47_05840 [Thalassospira sp. MCCC 1A02803]